MSSAETPINTNIYLETALVKSYGLLCMQKEQLIGRAPPQTIARLDNALSQLEEALAESGDSEEPTVDIWSETDLQGIGVESISIMSPQIAPKPGCQGAVAQAAALAPNDLWSSENFIRQLYSVTKITCIENETRIHGWVNAFFRRVMAMLPQDNHLTLHMETQLLPEIQDKSRQAEVDYCGSGFMYYTVMLSRQYSEVADLCECYEQEKLKDRLLNHRQPHNVILVAAADSEWLSTCVSQVIYKMYTFAISVKKKNVRGALTNGDQWIFLILTMNDDFSGGTYRESEPVGFNFISDGSTRLSPLVDDDFKTHYITAILMNWVQNSFSDLDDDDLFLQKIEHPY